MSNPAIIVQPTLRTAVTFVLLLTVFVIAVALVPQPIAEALDYEDGFVEITSALAYVAGLIVTLMLARRTGGWVRAHWLMWAVLCVMFFGEETSWLQSWLRYDTPESVRDANAQGEFNLHNLGIFSAKDEVFGDLQIDWNLFKSSQLLFNAGFGSYFLLLPLLMRLRPVGRLAQRFGFPALTGRFVLMTWIPIAVSVVLTYLYRNDWSRKSLIGETREMFFALTICAFIAIAHELVEKASAGSGLKR